MLMGHPVFVDEKLENPTDHQHEEVHVEIAVGKDIGFRWNDNTKSYELVTDLQTWNQPVPVERFIDKLSQQYAIEVISAVARDEGYEIESQDLNNTDQSVEMVVTKWI